MSSVTARINKIKQPRGGYIKPAEFEAIDMNDEIVLNEEENVHASIVGMAVDYLTRFNMGTEADEAFKISIKGANQAERFGIKKAVNVATKLLKGIKGIDDKSVVNACKLVTFDVWYRNPIGAITAKGYKETNPDKATIQNIQALVNRSLHFFDEYGPIKYDGFTFAPVNINETEYLKMLKTKKGTYGGYTAIVDTGDGDFLTEDTLWDFKVSKSKPTNKHTLQLLMYWIMGQHSGQEKFKSIKRLGIFNPRLNKVYLLNIKNVPEEIIRTVEKEVIGYE